MQGNPPKAEGLGSSVSCVSMGGEPVLSFDNEPSDFRSALQLLDITEAAKLLTVSVTTIRRLQQALQIPFIRVGRSIRFLKSDLLSYVESRKVKPIG